MDEKAASNLALKILGMLEGKPKGMTRTDINCGLGRRVRAKDIGAALAELLAIGVASSARKPTGRQGRPTERWLVAHASDTLALDTPLVRIADALERIASAMEDGE